MTPLHLTRAVLPAACAARAQLFDAYRWHQKTWDAFPGRPEADRDFLSRLDLVPDGFRLTLLSHTPPVRPDWWDGEWQSRVLPEALFSHTLHRFQLRANPTVKRVVRNPSTGEKKKNGRREPITSPDELRAWLKRKADGGGFRVLDGASFEITPFVSQPFYKKGAAGLHAGVGFSGDLEITDPQRFRDTMRRGIGSAKGFGFGLLMISPL